MSYSINQGYFIFGNVDSRDYGVYLTGQNAYNAPKKRVDTITIPGRSGTLTLNGPDTFDDIELVYPAFIASNYAENIQGLRNALNAASGKKVLYDSYDSETYMLARFDNGISAKTLANAAAGSFDIAFQRDPRRFLFSGNATQAIVSGGKINNPTLFDARPTIRVAGAGTLAVGDMVITIASNSLEYIDIDSELMDCHCGQTNANSYVTFSGNEFPVLPPGETGFIITDLTSVSITPMWWRL